MKLVLFLCILAQFLYASGAESTWPRVPKCMCTVNVPPAEVVGKASGYGANGNVVKKNALLNVQKHIEEIRQELAKLRTG
ncbi:hypothetical protein NP493_783g00026 [Ridgeia piscesae]|uniref:Uncharacterized protein n=1 Tax=Ridgeia piscesae TaxID=27915 RepID=A0AAD9KNA4_RIDPI|nr:hypothetical protein NP493_783g00026 [Ridgeia piscesae]